METIPDDWKGVASLLFSVVSVLLGLLWRSEKKALVDRLDDAHKEVGALKTKTDLHNDRLYKQEIDQVRAAAKIQALEQDVGETVREDVFNTRIAEQNRVAAATLLEVQALRTGKVSTATFQAVVGARDSRVELEEDPPPAPRHRRR